MPCTGMSSPQRTTNFPARSVATKERLVSPPVSGTSDTAPRQNGKPINLSCSPVTLTLAPRIALRASHAVHVRTSLPAHIWALICAKLEEPMPDAALTDTKATNTIAGRDAFLAVLRDEGVVKMFGNPGTTELPIMHALSSAPEMGYVLALQEAVVIAMADGYARASGKLVSCNVHVAPGLGNAIGSIYTSLMSGTPMIVTAGPQEQGHGPTPPPLYAPPGPISPPGAKWAGEGNR